MNRVNEYRGYRTGRFSSNSSAASMREHYERHYHPSTGRYHTPRSIPIHHPDNSRTRDFTSDLSYRFGRTTVTGRRVVEYTREYTHQVHRYIPANKCVTWGLQNAPGLQTRLGVDRDHKENVHKVHRHIPAIKSVTWCPVEEPGRQTRPELDIPHRLHIIHKYVDDVVPPARVEKFDLCIEENALAHHTDKYEITTVHVDELTQEEASPQLVVRRGQPFIVKVILERDYDADKDTIVITSEIGRIPMSSKGTRNEITVGGAKDAGEWYAEIMESTGKELTIHVSTPITCPIGKWTLILETQTPGQDGKMQSKHYLREPEIYILFNPWCQDDPTYMDDDEWRNEYVLNDSGKVYTGNYKQIFGKPWNFGQFDDIVLQAAVWLLDFRSGMQWTNRGNPVAISRKLSALVNSSDDNGVLTGRWDGEYADGISPTKWNGSVAILKKYMENKTPVQYGQCWVFSGVLTSICRALGLPARSVTNFASAHDTDGSLTIDMHWNVDEKPMPELDTDSVWNFHVWNEAWMARPDLPSGYGGWQAIDATPQETSDGIYCAGPASVRAIKNGDVTHAYDAPFIFAEVNGDKVHWVKMANGPDRKVIQKHVIGKNISTKQVGPSLGFSYRGYCPDREDVTLQYKFPEGSSEERAAVWRASQVSTKPHVYKDESETEDVRFETDDLDQIMVGDDFETPIKVVNTSNETRTVSLSVTLSSVYYTGVTRKQLKKDRFNTVMAANSTEVFKVKVTAAEYMGDMVDFNYAMKINYLATVTETKQMFAGQDDFRLRTIIPDVKSRKSKVNTGDSFMVDVSFKNPLKESLTGCVFSFESAGNMKPQNISTSDVLPGGICKAECEVKAKRKGECVVIVGFECKQLGDLQGQCAVEVD